MTEADEIYYCEVCGAEIEVSHRLVLPATPAADVDAALLAG